MSGAGVADADAAGAGGVSVRAGGATGADAHAGTTTEPEQRKASDDRKRRGDKDGSVRDARALRPP